MNASIRHAKLSDVNILDSFQNKIGIHERPLDPNIKRKGKIKYYTLKDIKRLIKSKNSIILIAEMDGKPVGCGFGEIKKNNADWSRYKHKGYMGMMFVEKSLNRRGIGGMILERLLEWLKKNKIKDIRLDVYENNTNSVAFYRKHGFKDYLLEMVYRPD